MENSAGIICTLSSTDGTLDAFIDFLIYAADALDRGLPVQVIWSDFLR